jgi:hypothetical protein
MSTAGTRQESQNHKLGSQKGHNNTEPSYEIMKSKLDAVGIGIITGYLQYINEYSLKEFKILDQGLHDSLARQVNDSFSFSVIQDSLHADADRDPSKMILKLCQLCFKQSHKFSPQDHGNKKLRIVDFSINNRTLYQFTFECSNNKIANRATAYESIKQLFPKIYNRLLYYTLITTKPADLQEFRKKQSTLEKSKELEKKENDIYLKLFGCEFSSLQVIDSSGKLAGFQSVVPNDSSFLERIQINMFSTISNNMLQKTAGRSLNFDITLIRKINLENTLDGEAKNEYSVEAVDNHASKYFKTRAICKNKNDAKNACGLLFVQLYAKPAFEIIWNMKMENVSFALADLNLEKAKNVSKTSLPSTGLPTKKQTPTASHNTSFSVQDEINMQGPFAVQQIGGAFPGQISQQYLTASTASGAPQTRGLVQGGHIFPLPMQSPYMMPGNPYINSMGHPMITQSYFPAPSTGFQGATNFGGSMPAQLGSNTGGTGSNSETFIDDILSSSSSKIKPMPPPPKLPTISRYQPKAEPFYLNDYAPLKPSIPNPNDSFYQTVLEGLDNDEEAEEEALLKLTRLQNEVEKPFGSSSNVVAPESVFSQCNPSFKRELGSTLQRESEVDRNFLSNPTKQDPQTEVKFNTSPEQLSAFNPFGGFTLSQPKSFMSKAPSTISGTNTKTIGERNQEATPASNKTSQVYSARPNHQQKTTAKKEESDDGDNLDKDDSDSVVSVDESFERKKQQRKGDKEDKSVEDSEKAPDKANISQGSSNSDSDDGNEDTIFKIFNDYVALKLQPCEEAELSLFKAMQKLKISQDWKCTYLHDSEFATKVSSVLENEKNGYKLYCHCTQREETPNDKNKYSFRVTLEKLVDPSIGNFRVEAYADISMQSKLIDYSHGYNYSIYLVLEKSFPSFAKMIAAMTLRTALGLNPDETKITPPLSVNANVYKPADNSGSNMGIDPSVIQGMLNVSVIGDRSEISSILQPKTISSVSALQPSGKSSNQADSKLLAPLKVAIQDSASIGILESLGTPNLIESVKSYLLQGKPYGVKEVDDELKKWNRLTQDFSEFFTNKIKKMEPWELLNVFYHDDVKNYMNLTSSYHESRIKKKDNFYDTIRKNMLDEDYASVANSFVHTIFKEAMDINYSGDYTVFKLTGKTMIIVNAKVQNNKLRKKLTSVVVLRFYWKELYLRCANGDLAPRE